MRSVRSITAGLLVIILSSGAMAQQGAGSSSEALSLLHDQLRALRSEVEQLRGMVEEQGFQVRRMQRDSMERYSDLDSRISALYQDLESGESGVPAQPAPTSSAPTTAEPSDTPSQTPVDEQQIAAGEESRPGSPAQAMEQSAAALPDPDSLSEQQLYQSALDVLLQEEGYQQSVAEFGQYLDEYPDGRFVTNAWYWMGQAYVNLSMMEEARDAFEVILNDYPDGRKIEDAMYTLGTVYDRMGEPQRAREMLQQVIARFPNTSAANLADIYLRSLN